MDAISAGLLILAEPPMDRPAEACLQDRRIVV